MTDVLMVLLAQTMFYEVPIPMFIPNTFAVRKNWNQLSQRLNFFKVIHQSMVLVSQNLIHVKRRDKTIHQASVELPSG